MQVGEMRRLLDSDAVTRLIAALPCVRDQSLGTAEAVAFWVKPGRHFNAYYRVERPGEGQSPLLVSAFALDRARAEAVVAKLGRHRCERLGPLRCPRCATVYTPPGLVLQLFPFDYRLPTLPDCLCAERVRRALGASAEVLECQPSGYRPGMRCQIRYRLANGTVAYGKVAIERQPGKAFAMLQRLHAALGTGTRAVRVPTPWLRVPELDLTIVHAVDGESLYNRLARRAGGGRERVLQAVAAALADFHALAIDGVDRVYGPADEISLLRGWVDLIADLMPALADSLRARAAELAQTRPVHVQPRALGHRDFYDKQVLLSPQGVTFLDLDTVCRAEPEIDVGNFCAHLWLRGVQHGRPAWSAPLETDFVAAYPAPLQRERVEWYRRAALLRLACVYALRPHGQRLAPALIRGAGEPAVAHEP